MKKSLMSQALFVSILAVAVAAGSGCERRGSAPKGKPDAALNGGGNSTRTLPGGDQNSGTDSKKTDASKPDDPKPALLSESLERWECKAGTIVRSANANGPDSAELKADVDRFWTFKSCAAKNGATLFPLKLVLEVDKMLGDDGKDVAVRSVKAEFIDLAKKLGNDDDARGTMRARLDTLKKECLSFGAKYAKSDASFKDDGGKEWKAADLISQLQESIQSIDDAKTFVDQLKTVSSDGSKL